MSRPWGDSSRRPHGAVGQDDFLLADGGELDRGAAIFAEAGEGDDFAGAVFGVQDRLALAEGVGEDAGDVFGCRIGREGGGRGG